MRSKLEDNVILAACRYVEGCQRADKVIDDPDRIPMHKYTEIIASLNELNIELMGSVLELKDGKERHSS